MKSPLRVAILQPSYLPWLGYFEQIFFADKFIFLNDVQYTKLDWRNRNRIKTKTGPCWLTVPIRHKNSQQLISEIQIDYSTPWPVKHLNLLKENYRKSPYFEEVMTILEPILKNHFDFLEDLNISLIEKIIGYLGKNRTLIKSSVFSIQTKDKNQRLIDLCKAVGAYELYDGQSAREFIDRATFTQNKIQIIFQNYLHPIYKQSFEPFISHLSIVDLLFNVGPGSATTICQGHHEN